MGSYQGRKIKAKIEAAGAGDNTIIAAPSDAKAHLEIDHIYFVSDGAVDVKIKAGASTDLTGPMQYGSSGTFAFDNTNDNTLELPVNTALVINLSAAVGINGWVFARVVGEA